MQKSFVRSPISEWKTDSSKNKKINKITILNLTRNPQLLFSAYHSSRNTTKELLVFSHLHLIQEVAEFQGIL